MQVEMQAVFTCNANANTNAHLHGEEVMLCLLVLVFAMLIPEANLCKCKYKKWIISWAGTCVCITVVHM